MILGRTYGSEEDVMVRGSASQQRRTHIKSTQIIVQLMRLGGAQQHRADVGVGQAPGCEEVDENSEEKNQFILVFLFHPDQAMANWAWVQPSSSAMGFSLSAVSTCGRRRYLLCALFTDTAKSTHSHLPLVLLQLGLAQPLVAFQRQARVLRYLSTRVLAF